jgi:hypothetical protein
VNKWPKVMLMSGATSAWLVYDMTSATEAPSQAVAVLQYGLLGCALFSLIGSLVMLASGR